MQAPENFKSATKSEHSNQKKGWMLALGIIGIAIVLCLFLWLGLSKRTPQETENKPLGETAAKTLDVGKAATSIDSVAVTNRSSTATFSVTGSVEPNQQQLQQITPLVSGRVEAVYVALGDRVKPGQLLVRIDSPQVAELHGKLHEAETRLRLAKANLNRVQQAANRVSVLKAKASLAEAEATLKRTTQLVSEGLTARKELVAAESQYERSMADYNFQKDISLNKEVAEAKAEFSTAQTEAEHIRDGLKALDAHLPEEGEGAEHNISTIELRSPIAGIVIERAVNPGTGFEPGKPLLSIANTTTLWVIANVPEKQMLKVRLGTPARISLEGKTINGVVSYIDPRLNEDTRTSRVRIPITNATNSIQVGSFAQVEFSNPSSSTASVFVPESAVQTVEGKDVVFVLQKGGTFSLQEVITEPAINGLVPILRGLAPGQRVAADGSFVLKSKVLKEKMGEQD